MSEKISSETFYNGYWYRSKLEAYTAVFLHINGIEFDNENSYKLSNGDYYKPDFRIEVFDGEMFIEAKGDHQWTEDGMKKVERFAADGHNIIVFGKEWPRSILDLKNQNRKDSRFFSDRFFDGGGNECSIVIGGRGAYGCLDVRLPLDDKDAEDCISYALNTAYKHINGLRDQDPAERIELTEEECQEIYYMWDYAAAVIDRIGGWEPVQRDEETMVEQENEKPLSQEEKERCIAIINEYLDRSGKPAQDFAKMFFPSNTSMGTVGSVMSNIRKGIAAKTREHLYRQMACWIESYGNTQLCVSEETESEKEQPVVDVTETILHDRVRRNKNLFSDLKVLLSVYEMTVEDLAYKLIKDHVADHHDLIDKIKQVRGDIHG